MHKRWNLIRLALPIGLVVALLMATTSVRAQTDATPPAGDSVVFGARPDGGDDLDPFRFGVEAGGHARATLIVSNSADIAVELRTTTADIETRINGGYQVVPDGAAGSGNAAWLSIDSNTYVLEPGEEIALELEITVPDGTPPGEYMAAVATETTESSPMEGTTTFRQISRKVNAVVITVPGPIQAAFELGAPSLETTGGSMTLIVPVQNTGNVRVKPAGTISIADADGIPVASLTVAMDSVYAWTATVIQLPVTEPLPGGPYTITADLADQITGAHAALSEVPLAN